MVLKKLKFDNRVEQNKEILGQIVVIIIYVKTFATNADRKVRNSTSLTSYGSKKSVIFRTKLTASQNQTVTNSAYTRPED